MVKAPNNSYSDGNHETDVAWEKWGQREPYYSVLTNPKYKLSEIDETSKLTFFESGRFHVNEVMRSIQNNVSPSFAPRSVLDFGCGVGRILIPFAELAEEVVGLDISPAMLAEARKNCIEHQVSNVRLALSDDTISTVSERFDLVHSAIVFQHIPVNRGKYIFRQLLNHISPGGVAALQVLYSKAQYADTNGLAPPSPQPTKRRWYQRQPKPALQADALPTMEMNPYNLNELLFFIQSQGVREVHTKFTDHTGELGVWLFFQVPFEGG